MNKMMNKIFIFCFLVILLLPLIFLNLNQDEVSKAENRKLSSLPKLDSVSTKSLEQYVINFEKWFSDHLGFRDQIITSKAFLDFHLFDKINTNDMYIGKNGSLIYATKTMLNNYHSKNIPSVNQQNAFYDSFVTLQDYVIDQGIQFYYAPCWDKQYFYPEEFLDSVYQYNESSRREMLFEKLLMDNSLNIIDSRDELMVQKQYGWVYGDWSDPTHWNNRGAYIGYTEIMEEIIKNNQQEIPILKETDYDLSLISVGYNLNNLYHKKDIIEKFSIKKPNANLISNKALGSLGNDKRHVVYKNDSVSNDLTLLVIGDSYIRNFIIDDLAESFSTTAMIWAEYLSLPYLDEVIETINPDIILLEDAERANREYEITNIAKQIKNKQKKNESLLSNKR